MNTEQFKKLNESIRSILLAINHMEKAKDILISIGQETSASEITDAMYIMAKELATLNIVRNTWAESLGEFPFNKL